MPLVLADRVRETTTTTGTGTVTLGGAVTGFQTFAAIGNGNTTYYAIAGQGTNEWEVGIGTYTAAGTTLSRDTVLASSNAGALVSFSAGVKDVFCDYPAGRAVYLDTATNATLPGLTVNGTQVIEASSTSAALRITQTGTGNALVVEDSANPDSTPFVIDQNGVVLAGLTAPRTTFSGGTVTPAVQIEQVTGGRLSVTRNSANAVGPDLMFGKTRGTSLGAVDVVASGDSLGIFAWQGADGTNLIPAASIAAAVDGTPGTNDMPGRLVFSTTADGASSPTERVRIDSAGNVGVGGTASAFAKLHLTGTYPTSGTVTQAVRATGTIPSGTTATAWTYLSGVTTQAAAFTLGTLYHYSAEPAAFGAGSAVTTQIGFHAGSAMTGATNNYGFYSNIASGTGRWNFYANGTAANYFAGDVGIGTTSPAYKLDVVGTADATTVRASNGIFVNSATISENYTIASGDNGLSAGPVTVASGVAVTVSSGSVWTVV